MKQLLRVAQSGGEESSHDEDTQSGRPQSILDAQTQTEAILNISSIAEVKAYQEKLPRYELTFTPTVVLTS